MSSSPRETPGIRPRDLRTEYERAPTNVDPTARPRFSWSLATDRRGSRQTAYRVVVGRDAESIGEGRGGLWDSERVDSDRATDVEYEGPALASDETYYWSVKLRTDDGETAWAELERFSTALAPEDWRGEWISHQPDGGDANGWRSRWRPESWDGEEWVQVDLGEQRGVDAVELYPAEPVDVVRAPGDVAVTQSWRENPLAAFGFPDTYRIEVADSPDFGDPTVVADVSEAPEVAVEGDGRARRTVVGRAGGDVGRSRSRGR